VRHCSVYDGITYQEFWLEAGLFVERPTTSDGRPIPEAEVLGRMGYVKLSVGRGLTEIKWMALAANWASLLVAKAWVGETPGPYTLKYFVSGWFSETIRDAGHAARRIDEIMAKSDIHLISRVYVRDVDPAQAALPQTILRTLDENRAPPEFSIDCVLDETAGRFRVERIGAKSAIAKLWGLSPVSFPCINGGSYDFTVAQAYQKVLKTGAPHYDHVLAAMVRPDGEPVWIPYQRLVLPNSNRPGRRRVTVVSEVAPVDITVV
jgi:hypothetical protein